MILDGDDQGPEAQRPDLGPIGRCCLCAVRIVAFPPLFVVVVLVALVYFVAFAAWKLGRWASLATGPIRRLGRA